MKNYILKLKTIRKVRGISQKDLSEAIGTPQQRLSEYENYLSRYIISKF